MQMMQMMQMMQNMGMMGQTGQMGQMGTKGSGKGSGKGMRDMHGDPTRLVYVGNLSPDVKWQELKDHMKNAGTVEFCKVLTEDGTDFGRSTGEGCVRYSHPAEAKAAIEMLANSELQGRLIHVDLWASHVGADNGGNAGPVKMKSDGKGITEMRGDPDMMVYVCNLPPRAKWQQLKDHMKLAGTVEFCKIITEDGTDFGKSTGAACVRYSHIAEQSAAIQKLTGTEFQGQVIVVAPWASHMSA
eukprot:gnl/TRDRNA2_/TRDRNA2_27645_c0_seq1.p1 gnl/TRDRNA2_/TRDRNA2_27645_c0~~gnl/TRDRNA2_/TRDRNA2_27645_c0_seq1.p1  ORF type:complete len:243 (-),score=38.07 gnl/TRDRNA2_/TRDRNA2_27645_c0_seq1:323-1051(-)